MKHGEGTFRPVNVSKEKGSGAERRYSERYTLQVSVAN